METKFAIAWRLTSDRWLIDQNLYPTREDAEAALERQQKKYVLITQTIASITFSEVAHV